MLHLIAVESPGKVPGLDGTGQDLETLPEHIYNSNYGNGAIDTFRP